MVKKADPLGFAFAFREHWFATMSGGASVPFTALAVFVDNKWAQLIFTLFALACAGLAAYRVWKPERQRVCELEAKLTSKIRLFINPDVNGVLEIPAVLLCKPGVEIKSKWVQFSIACATDAPLIDCEAWLTSVKRLDGEEIGQELVEERVHCRWSQIEEQKITLNPLLEQRVNLFSFRNTDPSPVPTVVPLKITLSRGIKVPGRFRVKVVVAANGVPSVPATFSFNWRDFDNLTLIQES